MNQRIYINNDKIVLLLFISTTSLILNLQGHTIKENDLMVEELINNG